MCHKGIDFYRFVLSFAKKQNKQEAFCQNGQCIYILRDCNKIQRKEKDIRKNEVIIFRGLDASTIKC
jgi:hypothetical protein